LGYENAKSIQSATLTQLDASRKTAEISLELARRNAENLLIRAPVNGTISKVLTSIGQSVATNTPVVEFTSNEPEMLLDIESNLARTLSV
jgi:multidrug resistance efflux pump